MKRKIGWNYGHVMKNWSCVFCGMTDEDSGFRDGCKKQGFNPQVTVVTVRGHLLQNFVCQNCGKISEDIGFDEECKYPLKYAYVSKCQKDCACQFLTSCKECDCHVNL